MRDCTNSKWAKALHQRLAPAAAWLLVQTAPLRNQILQAWQDYKTAALERNQTTFDRQFLPAVVELQESPPSPTLRFLLQGSCAIILIALLWSIFGKVDITAVADGQIIPTGRVKVIQPLETGVVKAIHVDDGSEVQAGDVLIELDLTQTGADRERLTQEQQLLEADILRLNALIEGKELTQKDELAANLQAMQQSLYTQTAAKLKAQALTLEQDLAQQRVELADAQQQVQQLEKTVALLNQRAARVKKLVQEGFYARNRFDLDETERLRLTRELNSQQQRVKQTMAAITGAEERLRAGKAEQQQTLLTELAEREAKLIAVREELAKAAQRNQLQTLTSPISGTVQELQIHTVGGVVTPAQALMKVVPFEDALEAEVRILNKDIGFIEVGQSVVLKLQAFPFTKYGTVDGTVKTLSLDATQDEELGPVYLARIRLEQTTIDVGNKQVVLSPGLALTAEVKTGTRRIIEYFLSPLTEYVDTAVRER